ncbi:MAG: ATP synthase F1 subunit epsilon [Alphaproteobacteria bacterium]|jgi:F-type H+-transporting ATPase subunit epsilon|nr:ATP synthase F1 subunit epsilon [Alphaproteobacteria bacterium]MCB1551983.1 ATP synthase F1 subunit epsilon [Alphaproteobacteria bacterium]MCB9984504.1 ATP synthase F1 subunit epsilon [Micavibrio sp.]HRK97731.1 ATP synthase F1 subunit epsilon [Alphaproteobacteria bacterium]
MDNTLFNFELVSPEQKLISEQAFQVCIPGEEGDVGVRAGHMALVMSVRPGVVEIIREQGGEVEKIFIAGGFADISQTNCTVLAEEAVPLKSLKSERLQAELTRLHEDMGYADTAEEKTRLSKRITIVSAMLDAVKAA